MSSAKSIKILSAGAVLMRETNQEPRFLLLRAYQHWDFPKGRVEENEEPLAAARREVAEETGITQLDFPWGAIFEETEPYSRGKVARYYLAHTREKKVLLLANPERGVPEHAEYRWVTFDDAWQLTSPRVRLILRWAANCINIHTEPPQHRFLF